MAEDIEMVLKKSTLQDAQESTVDKDEVWSSFAEQEDKQMVVKEAMGMNLSCCPGRQEPWLSAWQPSPCSELLGLENHDWGLGPIKLESPLGLLRAASCL